MQAKAQKRVTREIAAKYALNILIEVDRALKRVHHGQSTAGDLSAFRGRVADARRCVVAGSEMVRLGFASDLQYTHRLLRHVEREYAHLDGSGLLVLARTLLDDLDQLFRDVGAAELARGGRA
jgi:hypothetical protein